MLRDKAVLGYMGLSSREISVIHSLFKLTERFHHTYELPRESERRNPDVVFVNADSASAVAEWEQYAQARDSAIPIYVSTEGDRYARGVAIKRPLVLKKLMHVLDQVQVLSAKAVKKAEAQVGKSVKSHFNVLVVDDSLPVRTFMQQKLAQLSTVMTLVEFAESGEDAIGKMKREDYDLVFMDVMMPGMDGYKACKWIKANKPTQVVMLTSRGSPFDKVRGAMSGCNSYIIKPPQDNELKHALQTAVDKLDRAKKKFRSSSERR